jgi:hypothetical protein
MALTRRGISTWIGLVAADVVLWIIADSQGNVLLQFNATGTVETLLKILWVGSVLGLILLVRFGLFVLVRSRLRSTA